MTPTPDQRANHERAHSAVWHALLYILQWSDADVRRVKPGAAEAFMAALRQDGYSVALVQPAPALTPDPLREALLDILDLSKGEPSMGGGTSFPANAHRMGRIHNRARDAFGDLPLNIL